MPSPHGRVLIIAGSDSGGGAGIQGDIKTVSALGGYAMTAITALTAQNTMGVFGIHPIPEAFIAQQIELCLSDIGADAIKTGMLHSAGVIETVVNSLSAHFASPLAGEATRLSEQRELSRSGEGAVTSNSKTSAAPSPNPLPQGERAFLTTSQSHPSSSPAPSPQPPALPLVVDPVMVAKGGAPLLEAAALDALKSLLIPRATIITPNLPEAELLLGRSIRSDEADATDMKRAAEELLGLGCEAVLLKGGHGTGDILTDVLMSRDGAPLSLSTPRIATTNTHGTGCTFASAIATSLAQKQSLSDAVTRAHAYVQAAIARAPNFGKGNGPLGH